MKALRTFIHKGRKYTLGDEVSFSGAEGNSLYKQGLIDTAPVFKSQNTSASRKRIKKEKTPE